jgi:hypothetical protein
MIAVTARAHSPVHDDFWVASGHHLVDRNAAGGLVLTDAFLKAYLARPELVAPAEACPVERGLYAQLLDHPRVAIAASELALVADPDGRENLGFFLAFRDQLIRHETLEAAYMALVKTGMGTLPPIFIQHLTHVIARNAFDDCADGRVLRAAECFFRPQRITFHEGLVLLADEEAISTHEHDRKNSPLLNMLGGPAVTELEILTDENAATYKARSDAHDLVFDLTHIDKGRAALAEAMSIWTRHLFGVSPSFTPVDQFTGEPMGWFLSLDADGTTLGNKVWQGEALSEEERARVLALFTFALPDHPRIRADKRGKRGFVVLGSNADKLLRFKPQNLVGGLPLAEMG